MPSDKRARKRAAREEKMAALARQRKRRATVRRIVTIGVAVLIAIGLYAALASHHSKPTAAKKTTTTTVAGNAKSPTTTTTVSLAGDTTSANCPTSFTATLKKPTFSSVPPMIIDTSKTYSAMVTTDVGDFTIALDAKAAPKTVNSFVFLAENHFFDCVVFHRVIPGFMDQTGDPTGTGTGGPGYSFGNENVPTNGYTAGEVAMANTGKPNSDGSQFFILAGPYSNNGYSLFGTVTSGMSVVQKINADGNSSNNGSPPNKLHRMISVVISEA